VVLGVITQQVHSYHDMGVFLLEVELRSRCAVLE
jgi:hypothetical protein